MPCPHCNDTGLIGTTRSGAYVGPGPVPEDSRKFFEVECDWCVAHAARPRVTACSSTTEPQSVSALRASPDLRGEEI